MTSLPLERMGKTPVWLLEFQEGRGENPEKREKNNNFGVRRARARWLYRECDGDSAVQKRDVFWPHSNIFL